MEREGGRDEALEAARSISSKLRDHAGQGERDSRIAPASLEALKQSGMLGLWRPRSLGGRECDPAAFAEAAEEIAVADSAAAWMMHGSSAVWFDLRQADPRLVEEIVESAEAPVLGETFNRPMKAAEVDGGYRVTGSTPFASGCRAADWMGHTALAGDRFLLMYHPAGSLAIEEDWDGLGMRGTDSHTIAAKDVFVPAHRVIDLTAPVRRRTEHFQGALYRIPEIVIPVAVAAVSLGVLRGALEAVTETAERKTPFASSTTLKHRALAQAGFGKALALYRAARAYLQQSMQAAAARAQKGDPFDMRAKADMLLAFTHTLQSCNQGVRLAAGVAGSSGVYRGRIVERALRDAQVIAQHAFGAEGRFATAAQAFWGVDVDFPLLAMD